MQRQRRATRDRHGPVDAGELQRLPRKLPQPGRLQAQLEHLVDPHGVRHAPGEHGADLPAEHVAGQPPPGVGQRLVQPTARQVALARQRPAKPQAQQLVGGRERRPLQSQALRSELRGAVPQAHPVARDHERQPHRTRGTHHRLAALAGRPNRRAATLGPIDRRAPVQGALQALQRGLVPRARRRRTEIDPLVVGHERRQLSVPVQHRDQSPPGILDGPAQQRLVLLTHPRPRQRVRADDQHAAHRAADPVLEAARHAIAADKLPLIQEHVEASAMQVRGQHPHPRDILMPVGHEDIPALSRHTSTLYRANGLAVCYRARRGEHVTASSQGQTRGGRTVRWMCLTTSSPDGIDEGRRLAALRGVAGGWS